MLAEFVSSIRGLAERAADAALKMPEVQRLDNNRTYYRGPDGRLCEVEIPRCLTVHLHTLDGIVGFIADNNDEVSIEGALLCVDHCRVRLDGHLDEVQERDTYAAVSATESQSLPLGSYLDQEMFVIGAQGYFRPSDELARMLKIVGNVAGEEVGNWSDDGVTQQVATRKGVSMKEATGIVNPFMLVPYRSFTEIELDPIPFILRARRREGQPPTFALFETDSQLWRLDATRKVQAYLRERLAERGVENLTIIG